MISEFTGYRGTCAMAQIGKVKFCILAKNPKQLALLWEAVCKEAGPLEPEMCQRAILIEAKILPPKTTKRKSPVVEV
jgi:hypothetical protein